MSKSLALILPVILVLACGGDKDSGVLHFDHCDLYLLHIQDGATDPAWSPDGDEVVFVFNSNLWSIPVSGGAPTQLTSMSGRELFPNWSWDDQDPQLVFINSTEPDHYSIYTLSPGGAPVEVKAFTKAVQHCTWSRDGTKIVFVQSGVKGIFTVPAAGGEVSSISNTDGWETVEAAQASPARDVVIYVDAKNNIPRINSVPLGGGPTTVIGTFPGVEHPNTVAESHDGAWIAFTSPFEWIDEEDLLLLPSAGGAQIPLTNFITIGIRAPSWSPDDKKIALQMPTGIYITELKL